MKAKELNGYYYCFSLMNGVMIFTVLPKCHERKQYSQQLITEYVYIWLSIERQTAGKKKELPLRIQGNCAGAITRQALISAPPVKS